VKKMLTKFSIAAVIACGTLGFGALYAHADDKNLVIGAIYLDTQGYYAGVRQGIQNEAKALGKNLEIIETNAQGDISKESSFIDRISAAGVHAIILSAVSTDGSVRAVRSAHDAGIPIVCYNTCVNDEAIAKYVYAYVIGDPFEFGSKIGDAAADYFVEKGVAEPKIGVINCEAFEVCISRRKGFEQALHAKVPGAKIVANQEGTILDKAISVGEQLLSANPDLDAFFGESGGATLGAVKAVRNRDMIGKTAVFGSDMTSDIAAELKSNEVLKAVVDISGLAVGKQALDAAVDAIKGQKLDSPTIPAEVTLYKSSADGQGWLEVHADGIP
jgi:sugar transport system substrate-binding protein